MRTVRLARRIGVTSALTVAAALVLAPSAFAADAPQRSAAVSATDACEVVSVDVTWGIKESFRSYISGTIASGA